MLNSFIPSCIMHSLVPLMVLTLSWPLTHPCSAFNNILSNLGHVLLGFLFLLIVLCRDILHRRALEAKDLFAMVRREWVGAREGYGSKQDLQRSGTSGLMVWWVIMCNKLHETRSMGFQISDVVDMALFNVYWPPFLLLQEYGIPKHFGLFYAMGIALMMEGVLSACYHVCPNYSNFQFGN